MTTTQQIRPAPAVTTEEEPLLDQVLARTVEKLDALAGRYSAAIEDPAAGRLQKALLMASGIDRLERMMDDRVMAKFMALMNTRLGFRTDRGPGTKNPTPYSKDEVRRVLIAGLLRGVYPVGNELNIISGDLYVTQSGWQRKVKEVPGLTDLKLAPGVPVVHNGYTVVRFGASWRLHGRPDQLEDADGKPGRVFPIIVNANATADNILGKAKAKALHAIYEQATGSEHSELEDGEVEDLITPAVAEKALAGALSKAEQLADKLGAPSQATVSELGQREPGEEG